MKKLSDPDFKKAVADVTPLSKSKDRIDLDQQKPKKKPYFESSTQSFASKSDSDRYLSDQWQTALVDFEQFLSFKHDGVDYKTMLALKKGQISVQDYIDLHGFTTEQARQEVSAFIDFARMHHLRCIKIIHGKGYAGKQDYPLMKNRINSWLRQHPQVLAFHSAIPKDGGSGAVYVLLKTR